MVEISVTDGTTRRSVIGNRKMVTADVTSVGNGETWTVPYLTKIINWGFTCTTDDTAGGTVSGNVITIADGAAIAGTIWAIGW